MSRQEQPTSDPVAERRTTILDAAERCFVLHGFHRATMQDLARMAGMSVGNLYRYFAAKDAVVLALAERDRAEAARHLYHSGEAPYPALIELIRHHLVNVTRDKAVLLVEVWAEGTRNPSVATMLERFDAENQAWVVAALQSAGPLSDSEAQALADRVRIETQGILVSRAVSNGYDPAPAVERLIACLEHGVAVAQRASVRSSANLDQAA